MNVKKLLIGIVALVVVIAAVIVFLVSDVDKYRPRVQSELQSKLNRPVTIGHLGLSWFPFAIRADGLTIGESPQFPSSQPFATANQLYVSAGLLSLLSGNPEVKSISLDQPHIELIRNAAGKWNFSTLGSSSGSSSSSSQLRLDELKLTDGQIGITDQAAKQARALYDHIDLALKDFEPNKAFGVDASVHFPGQGKQGLGFKGKVGPLNAADAAALPVEGHISLSELSLAAINRFASGVLPPQTDSTITGDADVSSQGPLVSAKGNIKMSNTVLRGSKLDFPINADYDLSSDRQKNLLTIRSGKLDLGSTSFNLSGAVNTASKPANLDVRVSTKSSSITELAKLAGAFGVAFNPAYQVKGFVTADISAKGSAENPVLNGSLSAKQVEASGGEIKQPVSVPEVSLTFTPEVLKTNSFSATSGSTTVNLAATVMQYTTANKTIDATISTGHANIAELLNMAKAYGVDASKGASATGTMSANVHVTGPLANSSKLAYAGTAAISGANITTPELTKPLSVSSANLTFSQNSVAISNLAAAIGTTSVHGSVSASNFAAPNLNFALAADKIDTDEVEQLVKPSKKPATATKTKEEPSLINTMTGGGTLAANLVKAQDFNLSNVKATCKLDHGVITLSPLSAGLFGGSEQGALTLDLRRPVTDVAVNARFAGVDTNALLSAVSTAKNTLYGSLAATTNIRFALVSSSQLAQTLNGTVGFDVANGELKNVNILNEIAKVGRFLGSAPAGNGSSTALRKFSGTLNIVNGVATTNNLVANLDAASMSATGSMNLASQALNLKANAVLGSGLSQSVGGNRVGGFLNTALANGKGELVVPVNIGGTMSHPSFTPDTQAIAKMKLNNLLPSVSDPGKLTSAIVGAKGGGVGGILNGVLGGGKQAQPQTANQQQQQQQQASPADTVNSILGQFGKKKKKQ